VVAGEALELRDLGAVGEAPVETIGERARVADAAEADKGDDLERAPSLVARASEAIGLLDVAQGGGRVSLELRAGAVGKGRGRRRDGRKDRDRRS